MYNPGGGGVVDVASSRARITAEAGGAMSLVSGAGHNAHAQVGHGGGLYMNSPAAATLRAKLTADDAPVLVTADSVGMGGIDKAYGFINAYSQIGHGFNFEAIVRAGALNVVADWSADRSLIRVTASPGTIRLAGGDGYRNTGARIGHGGAYNLETSDPNGANLTLDSDWSACDSGVTVSSAGTLILGGGRDWNSFAQIGHGDSVRIWGNQAVQASQTGLADRSAITVTAGKALTLEGRSGGYVLNSQVQIGHGGSLTVQSGNTGAGSAEWSLSAKNSPLAVSSGGALSVTAAQTGYWNAYAQIGHGGGMRVDVGLGIDLDAGGSGITIRVAPGAFGLTGGQNPNGYAQIGHGGGVYGSGSILSTVVAGNADLAVTVSAGNVSLKGGTGANAYAQIGHGGGIYDNAITASPAYPLTVNAEGSSFTLLVSNGTLSLASGASSTLNTYTQVGHGGLLFEANYAEDSRHYAGWSGSGAGMDITIVANSIGLSGQNGFNAPRLGHTLSGVFKTETDGWGSSVAGGGTNDSFGLFLLRTTVGGIDGPGEYYLSSQRVREADILLHNQTSPFQLSAALNFIGAIAPTYIYAESGLELSALYSMNMIRGDGSHFFAGWNGSGWNETARTFNRAQAVLGAPNPDDPRNLRLILGGYSGTIGALSSSAQQPTLYFHARDDIEVVSSSSDPTSFSRVNFVAEAGGDIAFRTPININGGSLQAIAGGDIEIAANLTARYGMIWNNMEGQYVYRNGRIGLTAGGDLSLTGSGAIRAYGYEQGAVNLYLQAGGKFLNQSSLGASALSASNGRWLVRVGDAYGSRAGGLTGGRQFNAAAAVATWTDGDLTFAVPGLTLSDNGFLMAGAAPVVAVTAGNATSVYGGAVAADWGYSLDTSKLILGDTLADFNAALVASGLVRATNATSLGNVGSNYYTAVSGLSSNLGYTFGYARGTYTITPAGLILSIAPAAGQGKTYGSDDPLLAYTVGGWLAGDAGRGLLTGSLGRIAGENVGLYDYTAGTLSAGPNYTVTIVGGAQFRIDPATLTVTANPGQQKVYGYADPAALGYAVSGWKLSDGAVLLSGQLGRAAGENAGGYAITRGTLAVAGGNYILNFVPGTFTIAPRKLTVTAESYSRVYGEENPDFAWSLAAGTLVGTDTLSGSLATDATAGSNVGVYGIAAGTLSAGSNYTVTVEEGVLAVTPRPVTVTPDEGQSHYRDGDNAAPGYTVGGMGLYGSDQLAGALSTAALPTAAAKPAEYAVITQGTVTNTVNPNYDITFVEDVLIALADRPATTPDSGRDLLPLLPDLGSGNAGQGGSAGDAGTGSAPSQDSPLGGFTPDLGASLGSGDAAAVPDASGVSADLPGQAMPSQSPASDASPGAGAATDTGAGGPVGALGGEAVGAGNEPAGALEGGVAGAGDGLAGGPGGEGVGAGNGPAGALGGETAGTNEAPTGTLGGNVAGAGNGPTGALGGEGAGAGDGPVAAGAGDGVEMGFQELPVRESDWTGEGFMAEAGAGREMAEVVFGLAGAVDSRAGIRPAVEGEAGGGLERFASGDDGGERRATQAAMAAGDTFMAIKRLIETLDRRLDALPPEEADRLRPLRERLVREALGQAEQVMRLVRRLGAELRRRDSGRENDGVGASVLQGIARVIDLTGDRLWVDAARIHALSEGVAARLAGAPLDPAALETAVEAAAADIRGRVSEIRLRRDGVRDRRTERRYRELLKAETSKPERME